MKNIDRTAFALLAVLLLAGCAQNERPESISGIYPSLAFYNNEGECGTGAVVPWNGKLWVITYGPHLVHGSSDKLYEIAGNHTMTVRDESIGGTAANRLIHRESGQLLIGPYAIDGDGNVRRLSYTTAPGRYTGTARHLTDPENKVYTATMEEGFYEIDANNLTVSELYPDSNMPGVGDLLPGAHGKGLYSGQGVLVFSNNGERTPEAEERFDVESGSLCEWDGRGWTVIRRNQFTEITGPGGIYGNANPDTDPLWAVGWDHKSLLLAIREPSRGWSFYRLPKASHSYDGAHGWNTEWPRIRDVGAPENPDYLMTMHGMFWKFPHTFSTGNSAGIRPRSAYLKVIGDFARWNGGLVFGCDDSAQKEFLNKRGVKGAIEGPGQSNSNLWFTSYSKPGELGPATAEGAVWAKEKVEANVCSEPFMFAGWDHLAVWLGNDGPCDAVFTFETDIAGNDRWNVLQTVEIQAGESAYIPFIESEKGEWIRVRSNVATTATASFAYKSNDARGTAAAQIFDGLTPAGNAAPTAGLLYGLGDNRRTLGLLATTINGSAEKEAGYYELNDKLELVRKKDGETASFIRENFTIPRQAVSIESGSVLVIDDKGRRWRLPLGNPELQEPTERGQMRICREVATERDLFNCMGTFYELPAENADGFAKIRPVASHGFFINDYASYRGMLVMTGVTPGLAAKNPHIVVSEDKKAAVWVGAIDDLWSLGKPTGTGGPWNNCKVKAGEASDPYLMAFYDRRTLTITHDLDRAVNVRVEMDPTGNGDWMEYATRTVKPGDTFKEEFPAGLQAHWIRFISDENTGMTTWLEYK